MKKYLVGGREGGIIMLFLLLLLLSVSFTMVVGSRRGWEGWSGISAKMHLFVDFVSSIDEHVRCWNIGSRLGG